MPYGYEKYRLDKNISPNTLIHEIKLIRAFLAFVNSKYKKSVELHEIRPIDVREFLDGEREKGLMDSTVNRKLGYIRNWFDYLWETNQIIYDFMPKFKYSENLIIHSKAELHVNYAHLLNIKPLLLTDKSLMFVSKLLFIFYMRGIRLRDIVNLKIDDFEDKGDTIHLSFQTLAGTYFHIDFEEPEEVAILLAATERALFRNVPFLFSSRVKGEYGPFRLGSLKDYSNELAVYVGHPIRSEEIRMAMVHYLYRVEGKTVEDLQQLLGLTMTGASWLLKESLERSQVMNYNGEYTANSMT